MELQTFFNIDWGAIIAGDGHHGLLSRKLPTVIGSWYPEHQMAVSRSWSQTQGNVLTFPSKAVTGESNTQLKLGSWKAFTNNVSSLKNKKTAGLKPVKTSKPYNSIDTLWKSTGKNINIADETLKLLLETFFPDYTPRDGAECHHSHARDRSKTKDCRVGRSIVKFSTVKWEICKFSLFKPPGGDWHMSLHEGTTPLIQLIFKLFRAMVAKQ